MSTLRKAWVGLRQNGCFWLALGVEMMERCVIQNAEVIHWILTYENLDVKEGYPLNEPPCSAQVLDDDIGVANWILRVLEGIQSYHEMYFSNG